MIHEAHLLDAIKKSGVKKIAIIDDAFDAPAIDDENGGKLMDYLGDADLADLRKKLDISQETLDDAIAALNASEYDSEALQTLVASLYDNYVTSLDDGFNPGGIFGSQSDNIRNLTPILTLLDRCKPKPTIFRVGSDQGALSKVAQDTHLIFVDFYLDPETNPHAGVAKKKAAKERALARVTELVKTLGEHAPSVVLMSTADVDKDADKFREDIADDKSLVFASRFAFVQKTEFSPGNKGEICVEDRAGERLLDVFQSYEFARGANAALKAWLESAAQAADDLRGEIERLHLKDFAFLVRFRLATEGQGLLDYLEWFFGETLLDALGRRLEAKVGGDARILALNKPDAAMRIDGAFDGPTERVADLFHKVRIEHPRKDRKKEYRLGDLYMSGTGKNRVIRAVMTPDCDLISRPSGERGAPRLLTVSGKVRSFDAPDASVAEFILINKRANSISWDKKDVESLKFDEMPAREDPKEGEFLGTLRPLYAQQLQRTILHDLGRVGVSVAPAIGMSARARAYVRPKEGKPVEIDIGKAKSADCYVMPGRGGSDKGRVLFKRGFAHALLERLSGELPKNLHDGAAAHIENLRKTNALSKLAKMHISGIRYEEMIEFGIFLTAKSALAGGEKAWCLILVEMEPEQ